jgi:hypothetical protein
LRPMDLVSLNALLGGTRDGAANFSVTLR